MYVVMCFPSNVGTSLCHFYQYNAIFTLTMQIVWQVSRWSNRDGVKMWEDYPVGVQRALERRLASRGPDSTGMYVYIGKQDRHGNDIKYWVDFTSMTEWSQDGLRRFEVRRIEILNATS